MPEQSGPAWVKKFPGSKSLDQLEPGFRANVTRLVDSLKNAGVTVSIVQTLRPPERAYLMHWSFMIANRHHPADEVPSMPGVDIDWFHGSQSSSEAAARSMVVAYGIDPALQVAPALRSNHTLGKAIDMALSWKGSLTLKGADGAIVNITTTPRNSLNKKLIEVARSYHVIHFFPPEKDRNHWSVDGH